MHPSTISPAQRRPIPATSALIAALSLAFLGAATSPAAPTFEQLGQIGAGTALGPFVQGGDGALYGVVQASLNDPNAGVIFRLQTTGASSVVARLPRSTYGAPAAPLIRGNDGAFYGTTLETPTANGVLFRVTMNGILSVVGTLPTSAGAPQAVRAGVVQAPDGTFFGTSSRGGEQGHGTVFTVSPTGEVKVLVSFTGVGGPKKGSAPNAALLRTADGNFYGTTFAGGAADFGTVFRLTPEGELTTLTEFDGTNGAEPLAPLIQGLNGNLYGTTSKGGPNEGGVVFQLNPAGGPAAVLAPFGPFDGPLLGRDLRGPVVQAPDGSLYGSTHAGIGAGGTGTAYRVRLNGQATTLHQFSAGATGFQPTALALGSDGNFYGASSEPSGQTRPITAFRIRLGATPVTLPASPISPTSATLNATVNPNGAATTVQFHFNTFPDVRIGSTAPQVIPAGNEPVNVQAQLNFAPGTNCVYRVQTDNEQQIQTQYGESRSFTFGTAEPAVILTARLPIFTRGVPVNFHLQISGNPVASVSFQPSGAAGLNFLNDGSIRGTPTETVFDLPINVTSSNGIAPNDTAVFQLSVNADLIETQPMTQTLQPGGQATFSVSLPGAGPFTYQWFFGNAPVNISNASGTTTSTLTIVDLHPANVGSYYCEVRNAANEVSRSRTAFLSFGQLSSRFVNISTRARVEPGERALIGGFVVQGVGNKRVLLRALGPSLTSFGVQDPLLNPTIELRDAAGALLAGNDDWRANQADVQATGLAPGDDRECALIADLPAGAYTVITRGVNDTSGVAIIEAYDLQPGTDTIRPINLSTRGFVGRGENSLIAGFVINGSAHRTAVIRALGPSLSAFGVSGLCGDPEVSVFNAQGQLLQRNRDFSAGVNGGNQDPINIAALGLAPSHEYDAALIISLPPGAYTAVVTGRSEEFNGIGLVELYEVQAP